MDHGSSRLPGPFKIKFKLDYRDFLWWASAVSCVTLVCCRCFFEGRWLTQHGEYLCQVEEKQLLDESIRSTRNTLHISNFPWAACTNKIWSYSGIGIFDILDVNNRNPKNFNFK